jgi:hypothetical protein
VVIALPAIAYLVFRSPKVQKKAANWVTARLSESLDTKIDVGGVDISLFDKIVLEDVLVEDLSNDTLIYADNVKAQIIDLSIRKRRVHFKNVYFWDARINLSKDSGGTNFQFILDSLSSNVKDSKKEWEILFTNVHLRNSSAKFINLSEYKEQAYGFNANDIDADNINLSLRDVKKSDSLTTFRLDNVSFFDKSGLNLNELEFNAYIDSIGVGFSEFILKTELSKLNIRNLRITPRTNPLDSSIFNNGVEMLDQLEKLYKYSIDAKINRSVISLADVALFSPQLEGMDEVISLSGNYRGTIDNFKVKKFNLGLGENTRFYADFDMQGLPDWDKTFIYFKTRNNTFDFRDLASIKLPDSSEKEYLSIAPALLDSSILTYQGSIIGFPFDFVAYGTIDGDLGRVSTDIAFKPIEDGAVDFSGRLITKSFKVGKFLNGESVGEVSLKTNLKGTRFGKNDFYAVVDGVIDSLYYNNYRIDSISIRGTAEERGYDGDITIYDENLKFFFEGKADLENEIPEFNFVSTVEKANLYALGLDKKFKNTSFSFEVDANFIGSNIDNLEGEINFDQVKFVRGDNDIELSDLRFVTKNTPELRTSAFRSDFIDFDIDGNYQLLDLDLSLRDYLKHFLPSVRFPFSDRETTGINRFNFNVNLKEAEQLSKFFKTDLEVRTPLTAKGKFDSEEKIMAFRCSAPEIIYGANTIEKLEIRSKNIDNRWEFRTGADKLMLGDNLEIYNPALNYSASDDSLLSRLTWNNNDVLTFSGRVELLSVFSRNEESDALKTDLSFIPSNIWIADSLWHVGESSMHIDSTSVVVDEFVFGHSSERIEIDGIISDNEADEMGIYFRNIALKNLNIITGKDVQLGGVLNGKAAFKDVYDKFMVFNNIKITGFSFRDEVLGDLLLKSNWDNSYKSILSELKLVKDEREELKAEGFYSPDAKKVDYKINFSSLPLDLLLPVVKKFSDGVDGEGSGELRITGSTDSPKIIGDVFVENGSLDISYTKIAYNFSDTIKFENDVIVFDNITLKDRNGNSGNFNGTIKHDFFTNMIYELDFETDNILALDTKVEDNDRFYGEVHASGGIFIGGKGKKVRLDMSLRSEYGTKFAISFENPKSADEYDFVKFVSENMFVVEDKRPTKQLSDNRGLEIYVNMEVTPDANVEIIFDSTTGDIITGVGAGTLRLVYDNEENLFVYGDYTVEEGDYLFTLQNFINKKFKIEQGGVISFNGDPYGAIIDAIAVYRLKASLYDLMQDDQYSTRATVDCKINLSQTLYKPAVKFEIELPSADQRTIDAVEQYISTQDDINRQMLSLLITGTFYTPEYLQGSSNYTSSTSNVVGATTSEMLSNQFSNWLSQISNDFDIGFNYRPGDEVNERQVEVALSTQILDNRVMINGNVGNNSNIESNNTNSVVGEVEVYVKLDNTGRVQLKAYNRSNDNYIYYTSPYTQGLGITFREEFNSMNELKKRNKQRRQERKLKRKKKREKNN